ncbi:MAG: hypothetical protein WBP45_08750 [Daejeonella sp.]
MSEYTKYFAIKSSSEQEVKNKLNVSKIISIVDADIADYWFLDEYKRNGDYSWVVVSAPAISGFDHNSQFYYTHQFDNLKGIFDDFIFFFQEEDRINWSIKLKSNNNIIEKIFYSDDMISFNDEEKDIFSKCFDKKFIDLEQFLLPGKSAEFLNYIGIPYMEMNDQDKLQTTIIKRENYSILASE